MSEWHFKKYGYEKYAILNDDGHEQATTHKYDNAKLIAAAPEIYEALELMLNEYLEVELLSDEPEAMTDACRLARNALSKARGEKND